MVLKFLGGDPHKREVQKMLPQVDQINDLEAGYEALNDEELLAKTAEFRGRLEQGETLDDLLPEAFAAVREAAKRTIGLRPYDVQLIGGITLHHGSIAEMRTGEGKTLVATLPVYLNALAGKGVHLVTVNDYLARRDARWMGAVYHALGMSVGILQMASRTENGKKAFLFDIDKRSPLEDQDQLRMVERSEAYAADITYGTNSEFGFDYLRDNLTYNLKDRVQRGHFYAIVDEVDNILIDEARTPLIISGPAEGELEWYTRMAQVTRQLRPEDYEVDEKNRTATLTETGEGHVEEILDIPLRDPERPEDMTPEQAKLLGYLDQAMRAQFLFKRNKDYLVQSGKVLIIDEFTGRLMPGRRWSEGLHQAIEAKEGVRIEPENVTYATITIQNYFRMYNKLAGMTGTALTEAEEFSKIYKLEVLPIPTNLEFVTSQTDELIELEDRDEEGYKFNYYANKGDPNREAVFFRRKDYPDVVYRTEEAKLRAITLEVMRYYVMGRPQLVGTTSVEHSERLSQRLGAEPLRRLSQVQLIRQAWLDQHPDHSYERVIDELTFLDKPLNELNVGEMRQTARSVGIVSFNPDDPTNIDKLVGILHVPEEDKPKLVKALQSGVPHQVLNARKHDEEAKSIARAGQLGMVTIATNMAGRGVDIKLGGELPDDAMPAVTRMLRRAGVQPFGLTLNEMRTELEKQDPSSFGIYEAQVKAFYQYLDDMAKVRALGGLHVIGSERHEARRIDNQLRGRAARQGDPGSSRFYLSLEDEVMRLFGGDRAENLMKTFNIDPSVPLEHGMLGSLVEQSQQRVEGYNFDMRKHLLEYDDVLNSQRNRIYGERDEIFEKPELYDNVSEMLHTELEQRIPDAFKDEEGPWKLLAFLQEMQPTLTIERPRMIIPTFSMKLVMEDFRKDLPKQVDQTELKKRLLGMARKALDAEREHLMNSLHQIVDATLDAVEAQQNERLEALDDFIRTIDDRDENEQPAKPQELLDELSMTTRTPLRLSGDQLRLLPEGDRDVKDALTQQIESGVIATNVKRLVGAFNRRLGENLDVQTEQLLGLDWNSVASTLLGLVDQLYDRRIERLVGENGQIVQTIDGFLSKIGSDQAIMLDDYNLMNLLVGITQTTRMEIDARTHRRGVRRVSLLNYFFLAARLIGDRDPKEVSGQILDHLELVQNNLTLARGMGEVEQMAANGATLGMLDPILQSQMVEAVGPEHFTQIAMVPLPSLKPEDLNPLVPILGRRIQNEIYRQVLLGAISELWVDYLTRVEALRVSIGMEAYAQRNPLVAYKTQASELFLQLLSDIRLAVVSRMFTASVRRQANAPAERESAPAPEGPQPEKPQLAAGGGKKKHRHH
jgi:preprotein translocase subunit SecA